MCRKVQVSVEKVTKKRLTAQCGFWGSVRLHLSQALRSRGISKWEPA